MFVVLILSCLCRADVFGAYGVKSVSVMEGDSVTLHTNGTRLKRDDVILWKFGPKDILIAQMSNKDRHIYNDKVKLDIKTRSLTITNIRTTDSGLYKLITTRTDIPLKIFNITVYGVCNVERDEVTSVSVMEGDSVTLHTNITDTQIDTHILWTFELLLAEIVLGSQTRIVFVRNEGTYKGRLQMNNETGSITITNMNIEQSGLYILQIRSSTETLLKRFCVAVNGSGLSLMLLGGIVIVCVMLVFPIICVVVCFCRRRTSEIQINDKFFVNEGDSLTLTPGHAQHRDDVMTWRIGKKHIATISKREQTVCVEERFENRVLVDPETGSLTIRNSRTIDSGKYQLEVSGSDGTGKSEEVFTVSIHEKIQNVSVMEGDAFTLNFNGAFMQRPEMIMWEFGHRCIAEVIGIQPAVSAVVDDSFRGRLELDHQTGRLTITNTRKTDAGRYTLKIDDSEIKFNVTVCENEDSDSEVLYHIPEDA